MVQFLEIEIWFTLLERILKYDQKFSIGQISYSRQFDNNKYQMENYLRSMQPFYNLLALHLQQLWPQFAQAYYKSLMTHGCPRVIDNK